jgi:hypothetical protein
MMDYDGLWMIIPNIVKLKKDIEVTNSEEFTTLHGFVVDSNTHIYKLGDFCSEDSKVMPQL